MKESSYPARLRLATSPRRVIPSDQLKKQSQFYRRALGMRRGERDIFLSAISAIPAVKKKGLKNAQNFDSVPNS